MDRKVSHFRADGVNKNNGSDFGFQWWLEKEQNKAGAIQALISAIDDNQRYKQTNNIRYARLYTNKELNYLGFYRQNGLRGDSATNDKAPWNIIRSAIDTLTNKIAKLKPRPLFLTIKGDWALQRKAKNLTQYVDGVFKDLQIYKKGKKVFRDAAIFGTGIMKVFIEDDSVQVERVFPDEIKIDDNDAVDGSPTQLHQVKVVNRSVLLERYGKDKKACIAINQATRIDTNTTTNVGADLIEVRESWHLPSGPGAKDGLHIISIDGYVLYQEQYNKDYYPFVVFHWSSPLLGFFGSGVAEELLATQFNISKLLLRIQWSIDKMAVPRFFVDAGSDIVSQHLNNAIGSIVKYRGRKPEAETATAMTAEVYNYLERLWQRGYETIGISQMSATSAKPVGLESGTALRTFHDIETERFAEVVQRWDDFYLELANMVVETSRDLYESGVDKEIKVEGKKFIEKIKWSEVDMDDDKFVLQSFPTNLLPTTPEGKLAKTQDLLQAGLIDPETAKRLLDFPDLEAEQSLDFASDEQIKQLLDNIVHEGKFEAPPMFVNMERARKYGMNTWLRAKQDGVSDERLNMIMKWVGVAEAFLTKAQAQAQTQMQAQQPVAPSPLGVPAPLPQSDLIPQV